MYTLAMAGGKLARNSGQSKRGEEGLNLGCRLADKSAELTLGWKRPGVLTTRMIPDLALRPIWRTVMPRIVRYALVEQSSFLSRDLDHVSFKIAAGRSYLARST